MRKNEMEFTNADELIANLSFKNPNTSIQIEINGNDCIVHPISLYTNDFYIIRDFNGEQLSVLLLYAATISPLIAKIETPINYLTKEMSFRLTFPKNR